MNMHHQAENRDREPEFDINRVDYQWIEKTRNIKELKAAYKELEIDGYFPDLLLKCGQKIAELDPNFKSRIEPEAKMSYEEEKNVNNDLMSFLAGMNATDKQLRNLGTDDQENKSIFSNGKPQGGAVDNSMDPLVQKIQNEKIAENERLKGNECVKAKDFKEAVTCYSRSLELCPTEAFTYANRAMAYLKLKDFTRCVSDASEAIKIKPGYLKAFHRRGKAYHALGKFEEAIKDFQFILEEEPENKDVNKDLKEARKNFNEKLSKPTPSTETAEPKKEAEPAKKKGFVRVAIDESSDDEPTITELGDSIDSKFPLKTPKEIEAHNREAKQLMEKGAIEFKQKFEQRNKEIEEEKVKILR